ncbi:MAG: site-2 protease family protein [Candidatus Omnitrophica bacterium]|nr:site-2 protease family protein [Candidatus Omnitrophota bacterium]
MRSYIPLVTLGGIRIKLHVTWLILPLLFGLGFGLKGVVLISCVFVWVTLHELCHAVQARRFGMHVEDIVLWPIGGVAKLVTVSEQPRQELITSAVGPLFNFVSAALLFYPAYRLLGPEILLSRDVWWSSSLETWRHTLASAFWINPLLGVFNLMPAFPMDGGRILRSLLARRFGYTRATEIAVTIGRGFAIIFGFVGLLSRPINLLLVLIAVFVYHAASQEQTRVALRSTLDHFRVGQVIPRAVQTVTPATPLTRVVEQMFQTHQQDFPVVDGERLVGFVPRSALVDTLHRDPGEADRTVEAVMLRQLLTVPARAPLALAQQLMESSGWRALPVVDEQERLVGMVTIEDIRRVYQVMSEA